MAGDGHATGAEGSDIGAAGCAAGTSTAGAPGVSAGTLTLATSRLERFCRTQVTAASPDKRADGDPLDVQEAGGVDAHGSVVHCWTAAIMDLRERR